MGSLVRDRRAHLNDQVGKLQNSVQGVLDEASQLFAGELPVDVAAVAKEVKDQSAQAVTQASAACVELSKIDISKLLEREQTMDDLRKIATNNLKAAYTQQAGAMKSIGCLRKAIKKALAEVKKSKGKANAQPGDEHANLSAMHRKMLAFMGSCADAGFAFGMAATVSQIGKTAA